MTVGIAAMCEYGDCIVLASDMRVTFRGMGVDPHDLAGKQYDFAPFTLAAAIAGSTSSTHAVISELSNQLRALIRAKQETPEGQIVLEHVERSLALGIKRELRRLQNCEMQADLGISLKNWLEGKLPKGRPFNEYAHAEGMKVLRRVRQNLRTQMGVILCGFLKSGPIFLRALGCEPIEDSASPAIYVIGGKGAIEAFQVLVKRKQNIEMGIARTILHVYEALAEAKSDKGVGEAASYVIMRPWTAPTPHGMLRFHPEHPTVIQWSKTYRLKDTEALESRTANDLINAAVFPAKVRRPFWLGPETLIREL